MVFIIAEIGVNWDGDFDLLRNMVKKIKKIGYDAVKFQAFKKELVENHPENSRLVKSSISKENIQRVDKICKDEEMEWFCTPMYEEAVEILNPYVKRFKIREYDGRKLLENSHSQLFEKIWKTGKEVIISASKSPKSCKLFTESKIKWLYCVPKYPSELNEIDFRCIADFDGYSNHHPDIVSPILAVSLGAEIIEIHVTPNKHKEYPDNNVSLGYIESENLIKMIRMIEKIKK